ncbi:MAG: amphi-Trp domain-containing protein [Thiotrichales bacterium]|nr:amphi-Trp domain-containing protein [Thiotrichales bacterium]
MSKKTRNFEHESLQNTQGITGYLNAISEGFHKGELVFTDDEEEIRLTPQALANIRIKVCHSKNAQQLSIKINWSSEEPVEHEDSALFIEAKKPSSKKKRK